VSGEREVGFGCVGQSSSEGDRQSVFSGHNKLLSFNEPWCFRTGTRMVWREAAGTRPPATLASLREEVKLSGMTFVWLFHGDGGRFASGVFSTYENAERWIRIHHLSGILRRYPLDDGAYQWAVSNGTFVVKKEGERSAEFIQRFADGSVHHHFERGEKVA
jgi:hypothetical protein